MQKNNYIHKYDVGAIRQDFPILKQRIFDHDLVYLDNGASTQKPQCVIQAIQDFYSQDYANVHRGIHSLSQRATDAFESARISVQQFINAQSTEEVIFTSGTTASINLVAQSFVQAFCQKGDEIIVSEMEHHSNLVPWQQAAQQYGLVLRTIPINEDGELKIDAYRALVNKKTRLVAVTHLSNALGTINPIQKIIELAHEKGAKVLIDGAQSVAHLPIDVHKLDCDFFAFSAHKMYGPNGVGVLYGKKEYLEKMPPQQFGGEMIKQVTLTESSFNVLPYKFEAGTPPIAQVIGFAQAIHYLQKVGMQNIAKYEQELTQYTMDKLAAIPGIRLIGTAAHKSGVVSFLFDDAHASDVGTLLDQQGIAVRVGHHCAMPVMRFFGVDATTRVSIAMYNSITEIDALCTALSRVLNILRR